MIKSVIDGYVTFEWNDGETHCLTINEYKVFAAKHNIPVCIIENTCNNCGVIFYGTVKFDCCLSCYV
jgi:hypothetical protein